MTTGSGRLLPTIVAASLIFGQVLAVSVLSGSVPAGATTTVTLYVTTTGGGTACTKTSPCQSIGEAANVAAADTDDNVIINVAAGTYDEIDTYSISADLLRSLSIEGAGASSTFVDGDKSNTVMAFTGGTVSLSGLTIENGGNADQTDGGGISNAATLNVSDTVFSSDSADEGGAIFNQDSLTLSNSTLSADTATESGGGIENAGQVSADDVSFGDTTAGTGGGGALWNASTGTATIEDSTFDGDVAPYDGGAIYNDGNLELNNSTMSGSRAKAGGAISNPGSTSISWSTLEDNSSTDGGAIDSSGTLVIGDSTLTGNSAQYGGAVDALGSLNLYDSTLSGNTTFGVGGGNVGGALYIDATANMIAGTVSENTGPQIDIVGGTFEIAASIIGEISSGGSSVADCQIAGTISDLGYNLTDDTTCAQTAGTDVNANPKLGGLAANGGPTETQLPTMLSPAIYRIPTGTTVNGIAVCPGTDQRGLARPVPGESDCTIGAVEPALAPTITKFSPTSGPVGTVVTITGTNLLGANFVTFTGVPGTITKDTATKIKVKVPSGATKGRIVVDAPGGDVETATAFKVT